MFKKSIELEILALDLSAQYLRRDPDLWDSIEMYHRGFYSAAEMASRIEFLSGQAKAHARAEIEAQQNGEAASQGAGEGSPEPGALPLRFIGGAGNGPH